MFGTANSIARGKSKTAAKGALLLGLEQAAGEAPYEVTSPTPIPSPAPASNKRKREPKRAQDVATRIVMRGSKRPNPHTKDRFVELDEDEDELEEDSDSYDPPFVAQTQTQFSQAVVHATAVGYGRVPGSESITFAPIQSSRNAFMGSSLVRNTSAGASASRKMNDKVHEAKMALGPNLNIPGHNNKRLRPEDDPENHFIKQKRQEGAHWNAIVQMMNEKRVKEGKDPSWTEAAVYGRFVRNAARIAKKAGEPFDKADYIHMKNQKSFVAKPVMPMPAMNNSLREHLLDAFIETQNSFWEMVAVSLEVKTGVKYEAEAVAEMWQNI